MMYVDQGKYYRKCDTCGDVIEITYNTYAHKHNKSNHYCKSCSTVNNSKTENINVITLDSELENTEGNKFTIVERIGIDKNRRSLYKVRFVKTGYETITSSQNIRRGNIKDYFQPIICNIGFLGSDTKFNKSKFHKKLYSTWKNMINRCNNPDNISYKSYGAKGYYMANEWYNYTNFFNDVQKLPGWNESNFSDLTIDKDGLSPGNKCYTKEHCQWVTLRENNVIRIKSQRDIVGISPEGQEFIFNNICGFAKEHNLTAPNIHMCLHDNTKKHKGWRFYFKPIGSRDSLM